MGGVNHGRALTVDVAYLLRARAYGRYGTLFVTKLEIAYGHHVSELRRGYTPSEKKKKSIVWYSNVEKSHKSAHVSPML